MSTALEPIITAAMRGQYELLLAESERAISHLYPASSARVLVRGGTLWRDWSALEGDTEQPGEPVPEEAGQWEHPQRFDGTVFVPVVTGAVGLVVQGLAAGVEHADGLNVLRRCLALALQTCERQRIAARNLDEVQALQRVATRILKSHDLGEILLHITQEAKRLLSSDICGVLLREGEHIVMRRCVGNQSPDTATLRMGPGQGLAGRVLERREAAAVEDYVASDLISRDFFHLAQAEMVRSALAAPLLGRDTVIGVLEVWRRRPSTFSPLDSVRLVALANLTSIAIENAELYARQNRMVDELEQANQALSARYDAVRSISSLTQTLMNILLQGGGLGAIIGSAATFLQAEAAIVDNEHVILASSGGNGNAESGLGVAVERLGKGLEAVTIDADSARWRAQPLIVEGNAVGWVLGGVGFRGDDITALALAQVAMIAAVHRLEQRAASRARAETIDALVWDLLQSSDAGLAAALDRASDIKLDLAGPLRLYLCSCDAAGAAHLERGTSSMRGQAAHAVAAAKATGLRAIAMQGQSIAVLCADEPLDDAERTAQRLSLRLSEMLSGGIVVVGGSGPCSHACKLSAAHRESQIALDVARQLGRTGAVVYDRAGVVGLLLSLRHESGMQRFLALNFGRLLREDEKQRDQLLQTLRVFFDVNGSQEAAASRLGVHRKTIGYRLAKISELTGLDLSTHDDRLVADLSLYVHQLLSRGKE